MAQPNEWQDTQRHETFNPRNPPNSVLNRTVRTYALWTYLGPLVLFTAIMIAAYLYWDWRTPDINEIRNPTVGTSGQQTP